MARVRPGRAHELERECVALMEAAVLHGREGEEFDAVVVEAIRDAVGHGAARRPGGAGRRATAHCRWARQVRVRLAEADVGRRSVRFSLV